MRDNSAALLTELDALAERIAAVLGRLRAFRASLAGHQAVGDVRLDLAALQRLAEETDRLTAAGDEIAGDAGTLVRQLRP
ncbi:MAG TPA: hypothetical protein VHN78_00690 [Chloroflexota bacterium]|nr:hypothetical protein [Chloroflexota bacterium]